MIALTVLAYFAIDLALFFVFWRWVALEGDDAGNNFTSLFILFFWPLAIAVFVLLFILDKLLHWGRSISK